MNIFCGIGFHKKRIVQEITIDGLSDPYYCAAGPVKKIDQIYFDGIPEFLHRANVIKCVRCDKIFSRWIPPPDHPNCQCQIIQIKENK